MTSESDPPIDGDAIVVVASSAAGALSGTLDQVPARWLSRITSPCRLLTPPRSRDRTLLVAIERLSGTLRQQAPELRLETDPDSIASSDWVEVSTPGASHRFETIRVPAWRNQPGSICLVTRLPGRTRANTSRPLKLLASLAHPRQRLASRLSPDREAAIAELASPWRPALNLLVGTYRGARVAIVTADVVVAELCWLALDPTRRLGDTIGPWEEPAVQRATELGLGVAGPHQIRLVTASPPSNAALALIRHLILVMGVQQDVAAAQYGVTTRQYLCGS